MKLDEVVAALEQDPNLKFTSKILGKDDYICFDSSGFVNVYHYDKERDKSFIEGCFALNYASMKAQDWQIFDLE